MRLDLAVTKCVFPHIDCIHTLFELYARRTPDAIAIVFEHEELTYRQLDERSNRLAHCLVELGVEPETLVGLCVERSPDLIIGMLGILKAGCAYVPLDPDYPSDRIQFVVADAQTRVVLTQQRLVSLFSPLTTRTIAMDADCEFIARFPDHSLSHKASPAHIAYVIYTSGSTGKPKGVLIPHANVIRLLRETAPWFHFDSDDVWTLFHSQAFDFSVWEIWGALLSGGRLVIVPTLVCRSPHDFYRLLLDRQVTILNQTPSAFVQLIQAEAELTGVENALSLRWVIFGGEALDFRSLRPWIQRHGDAHPKLVNMYGITETTVHVTYYPLSAADVTDGASSIIGKAIPDLNLVVLDEQGQVVSPGVPGELFVGGPGLARGYLNRPELTAQRFVPHPFLAEAGARLYRTGDRVRWRSDGNLEFLGRLDHQVKIRGHRIELGEVETVLGAHPAVAAVVAIVREEAPDDQRLIAYLVSREKRVDLEADLRAYLKSRLPGYMMPSHFVVLETLPLTPNGKVDRKALPAPDRGRERRALAPARTPVEALLVRIWSQVLGKDAIGIHDDFFALGGHSLLATRLLSQVLSRLGVELSLRTLFEAPTVGQLAARIEDLHCENAAFPVAPAPEPVVSPMECWLEYACRKHPSSPTYNVPLQIRLRGELDFTALQRALDAVIDRHNTLRSNFGPQAGELVVTIREGVTLDLPLRDLSDLPAREREEVALAEAHSEACRAFDLAADLLIRGSVWRLGQQEHLLLLTVHHLVFDGWSQNVLLRELSAFYHAFTVGSDAQLPELPIRYRDYAYWRQQYSVSRDHDLLLDDWNRHLAGNASQLELPTDRPRTHIGSGHGGHIDLHMSPQLTQQLHRWSREAEVTLFMTLMGAWQTLLYRYSGQHEFAVYTPMAGRNRTETEGLIGYFINTLPIRADFHDSSSFRMLVHRLRETVLTAYANQEVALERLDDLPRAQVLFVLQTPSGKALSLRGLDASVELLHTDTAKYELSLDLAETSEGLKGWIEYDSDLYDETTVSRMAGHLQTLLAGIIDSPDQSVSSLPLLTSDERSQLLIDWNRTETDYSRDVCIHTLFEQQVERTPDACALVFEGQELTYHQLNVRANQLAHALREMGVKPETLVGLCVERSIEMVVGVLGILKAGAAYVPLDPDYPPERLAFMLEDTQAAVLLTQTGLAQRLSGCEAQVICLDASAEVQHLACYPGSNPVVVTTSEQLAYVMYTSGSTGRPKGVCVLHRGIVRLIDWSAQVFSPEDIAGMLAATSLSFDPSVFELFVALCRGGCAIIAENALSLPGLAAAERVTFVNTVPSLMTELLREGTLPASVRVVALAGEALPGALVAQVYRQETVERVYNLYGPTETVYTTYALIPRGAASRPPIGRPIGNTQVYVLDEAGEPLPVGMPGELYIGGEGLAQGYLNRPELTAERFVSHPLSAEAGARLYRTGDRVRWLADGNLDYLGRLDHQVKIRGFRVELGEIEAVLSGHPEVEQAIVTAHGEDAAEMRLVAYVTLMPPLETLPTDLRSYLEKHLPEYMAPSHFVRLDALPLTPNGKVDRKALPAPDLTVLISKAEYVAPRTPTEELLTQIWTEVLRVPAIGVTQDFFALGGHSLLVLRALSRVHNVLGIELKLRALFEMPTIAQLSSYIDAQIDAQRRVPSDALAPPISPATKLMVSPIQRWLGYACVKDPQSATYNVPLLLRLRGELDRAALQQSLQQIVMRHETLRSAFVATGNTLTVAIRDEVSLVVPLLERSDLSDPEREQGALAEAQALACRPFDLTADLPIKAQLWRLDATDHLLLLNVHHLVFDGWSQSVLMHELTTLYNASVMKTIPELPALPLRYRDYAQDRQQWLESADCRRQLDYWDCKLAGTPDLLDLPTDRPRADVSGSRGGCISLNVSQELTEGLRRVSRDADVTLFMTLLAGWQMLLYRYSGQEDFVVLTSMAGRLRPETEGMIGCFLTEVLLRADMSGDPGFWELLGRVKETTLDAIANQDVPIENLTHAPRIQTMFVLQNTPDVELNLRGLEMSVSLLHTGTAKCELSLDLTETPTGLQGWIEYDSDLFDAVTVERIAGHLQTLLESISTHGDTPISRLPLLTRSEQQQLLGEWNGTETDYPRDACIHALFEQQVERTPDAVALVFEDRQLTYRELDERANQLAHFLQRLEVGPESLVGLCLERSLDLVVSVLGILKAGGAYVPLDPAYPAERLTFVLEDAAISVLLTQNALLPRFSASHARIVCLDTHWERIANQVPVKPACTVTAENLAYVIYTSGSTGKPKGVCVEHRSIGNILAWMRRELQVTPADRWLGVTTLSFDIATLELFLPLTSGASLLMASRETASDGFLLANCLIAKGVTILQATPATWRLLESGPGLPEGLKALCGGEALPADLAQQLLDQDCHLWNVYGPTETTIWSTCWRVAPGAITIGRPIANTQVYVLDANREPVPVGVSGELYIGGDGLTRGYLNRPELTAERFVPHPFSAEAGARLYRTGDRVRWRANGNLEFLGRLDHQVKIRGFRVELGEIEAALVANPAITQAVVSVREDVPCDLRLVAYVVALRSAPYLQTELKNFMRDRLPDYMVPAYVVELEAMPLSLNGKVDRNALPAPDFTRLIPEADFVAPATPAEEVIARLWSRVLGIPDVSVTASFFALGGHSLLAVQIVAQLRSELSTELSLREFFEASTVRQLARHLAMRRAETATLMTVPISPATELAVSPMQRWLGYASLKEPHTPAYNIPFLLRLHGMLDRNALEQALQSVVMRHETLRSAFTAERGMLTLTIRDTVAMSLPLQDLTELPLMQREQQASAEVEREACRPFDLGLDLLIRPQLWRIDVEEHFLLLNIHHLVCDGWSRDVLMRELAAYYNATVTGSVVALPDLLIQYRDYAWWRQSSDNSRQLDYWNKKLEGCPSLLELPTSRPRPEVRGTHGGQVPVNLSQELTTRLKEMSREAGVTLFMTLLAAWQALLGRYSGQEDFVVFAPMAGRSRPETEELIGYFVNVVPLRADLSGAPTFREVLGRVRETILDAFAHQDVALEQLSQMPRLQTIFVLQNTLDEDLALHGLEATVSLVPTGTAKYELSLDLEERDERLCGWIEYDADLYDEATVARMAGHFQILLEGIDADLNASLARLPLLTSDERSQLMVEWNRTETDYPRDTCVHTLFEQQVDCTPEACALVFAGQELTYRELNVRANQLAHTLQRVGVGPEMLVGICIERSIEMVVGVLAILKAGAAYVPLDPAYPVERLAFMLEDTGVRVLLTQSPLLDRLPPSEARILCIDTEAERIAGERLDAPDSGVTSDNPIYVMYTSGSTGRPKGVCIPHRGVVRLVCQANYVTFRSEDTFLQFASLSFDASTFEIWGCLLNGARLVISPPGLLDTRELGDLIRSQGITTLWLTASLFHLMVAEQIESLRGVRQLLAGGDVLSAASVRRCLQELPGCTLINGYGPTENTTFTTCYPMSSLEQAEMPVPIGRPIANTRVYVLDANRQPVPVGVAGELYTGGDGLAVGYLNCPELTAEKFVLDPFRAESGAKMYRTGDLVRWRPDGNLEFLGRQDQQVKIRGHRIELGEIETVLGAHPAVVAVVAVAREDVPGDHRLVAYIVARHPDLTSEAELKQFAREKLPEYMVPAHMVFLEKLPLSSNGKVDRKALPPPHSLNSGSEADAIVPGTPMQQRLASIWCEVLQVPGVGMSESFFALGGHSLLAIRLLLAVERQFGTRLSLAAMLQAPTVREMAALLEREQSGASQRASPIALQPLGSHPPLFLAPPGGGSLFYYRTLAAHIGAEQPLYALEPRGLGDRLPPHETVEEMAAYYIAQIRRVQARGPYSLGGYSAGGAIAYEMAQQLQGQGEAVALVLLLDASAPILWEARKGGRLRQQWWRLSFHSRRCHSELSACTSSKERLSYLQHNIRRAVQRVGGRVQGKAEESRRNPLIEALPEAYRAVSNAERKARLAYRGARYTGCVRLLRAQVSWPGYPSEPDLGWGVLAQGDFAVIEVPGAHYTFLEEPCIHVTVAHIRRILAQAQQSKA